MKTLVKDKASYFDEIIFLLYTCSAIKPLQKYIYTQPYCSGHKQNNPSKWMKNIKYTFLYSCNVVLKLNSTFTHLINKKNKIYLIPKYCTLLPYLVPI